ncbi:hypothetical protein VCHC59A1_3390B, partial [Vibrio cholerae HC-59A1]
ACIT